MKLIRSLKPLQNQMSIYFFITEFDNVVENIFINFIDAFHIARHYEVFINLIWGMCNGELCGSGS